jgi:hypothetical protein
MGRNDDGSSSHGCFFYGCMISIAIGVVLALGVAALVYYGYAGQAGVRATADDYLEAIEAGDYIHAYDLVSPDWQTRMSPDQFADFEAKAREALGGCSDRRLTSVNVQSSAGSSARAELAYATTCGSGPIVIRLILVRQEGDWLVEAEEYASPEPATDARITCPNCGTVNPPNANFCSHCGARLRDLEQPES